jgi:hypothetical protein
MLIPSATVRRAITDIWRNRRVVKVLSDPEWWLPAVETIKEEIKQVAVDRLTYVQHIFECEEFALALMYEIRRRRADLALGGKLPREQWRNFPLGRVVGKRFRGEKVDHWINICLTKEGLYLIEPQTREMWRPVESEDEIYFLDM